MSTHRDYFKWTSNLEVKSLFIKPHSCMNFYFFFLACSQMWYCWCFCYCWEGWNPRRRITFGKGKCIWRVYGFLKAVYFSIVNLLVVKVCVKFSTIIVTEDVLMNVTAYCMFCMILLFGKQTLKTKCHLWLIAWCPDWLKKKKKGFNFVNMRWRTHIFVCGGYA